MGWGTRCWKILSAGACLAGAAPAGAAPAGPALAAKIAGGLDAAGLAEVRKVEEAARKLGDEYAAERNFGTNSVGHAALFLNRHFDEVSPQLREKLAALARRADEQAGWNMTSGVSLTARCVEVITYEAVHQADIGWHDDGGTLITMMVMLSDPKDYSGGVLEFADAGGDAKEKYQLEAGDVVAWRGWTRHRVSQITAGERRAFVVEWWLGPDCAFSDMMRDRDDVKSVKHAAEREPDTAKLQRKLGKALCLQLPCANGVVAFEAEAALRRAVRLNMDDAFSAHALGTFLRGGTDDEKKEGTSLLATARALDPNNDDIRNSYYDVLIEEQKYNLAGTAATFIVVLATLMIFCKKTLGSSSRAQEETPAAPPEGDKKKD